MPPHSVKTTYSQKELIDSAIKVITEEYNPETDTFFLVHTKGARTDNSNIEQFLVGEIGPKTTLFFIWQVLSHFARLNRVHPFVYICRHVLAPFIDQDKIDVMAAMARQQEQMQRQQAESEEEPEFEKMDGVVFVNTDLSVKN